MEIVRGVHAVPVATPTFMGVYAPNVYLVKGEKIAFVDSGYSDPAAVTARLDYLQVISATLEYIILTHSHPDHIGGAKELKAITKAKVFAHYLELAADKGSIDEELKGGEVIELGGMELEVIHTPGHSPGHICLYLRQEKVLFSGDHIPGIGTTVISPIRGEMAQYIDSLKKLLHYEISLICPGHGPLIREPRCKIQELIQHRLEREEQVLNCLRRGKFTAQEIVEEIYPELDSRLYGMATDQVLSHLVKLEEEGRIARQQTEERAVYTITR